MVIFNVYFVKSQSFIILELGLYINSLLIVRPFKEYGISGISITYCIVCFSGKPVVLFLSDVSGIAAVLLLIMCYIFENVCFTARVLSLNHRLLCVCVIPSSECTSTHSIVWILVSRPV